LVGMRAGGRCVNNVFQTLREFKRAQIAHQALPRWTAKANYLLRSGRLYAGMMAHLILDPLGSKIHFPGRN
jgi:hypothetical protein